MVVECETDWEDEHSWTVRQQNNLTFPVPEELVTRLDTREGSRSSLALTKR